MRRGLDELRLGQRRGDTQDRLVAEEDSAFWHGVNVAAKRNRRGDRAVRRTGAREASESIF